MTTIKPRGIGKSQVSLKPQPLNLSKINLLVKRNFKSEWLFAKHLDMRYQTFKNILDGKVEDCSLSSAIDIANGLNVKLDDIINKKEN